MKKRAAVPYAHTLHVRDHCMCLHLQRTARTVARLFDEALKPVGLTNGQFSLLMSLNRPVAAGMGDVAALLGMDRTTVTASLKPLQRAGWISVAVDAGDRRGRRLTLTPAGLQVLAEALPIWKRMQRRAERAVRADAEGLRAELRALAGLRAG